MSNFSAIFKAYDVRGIYPDQIDEEAVGRIGQAFATVRKPKTVAVGRDVRASGEELKKALINSLLSCGVNVVDIGVITTDQLYFAVGNYGYDGGISVTASHNPSEYNGLKFAERGGAPISSEDLLALRDWALSDKQALVATPGKISDKELLNDYVEHVLGYIDQASVKPLSIVANANFGAVGRGVDIIAERLNLKLERLNWQEDGSFPKGSPNPLLPENRDETISLIKSSRPDFGVAWDADADRVFFFTGEGIFVPSAYIIALLAPVILKKYPNSKIVHDLTTAWVMDDAIRQAGGTPVANRTGHTFIKARMRQEDSPFAAESSGHYYFRDSFYADNGLVPFLMILEMISKTGKNLGELVGPNMQSYKVSGEMNFTVSDSKKILDLIETNFGKQGSVDKTDGLVVDSDQWRFSVRTSNTEPLLRLNAEARSQSVLDQLIAKITSFINT
jgi:phosphomannomutase